MLLEFRKVMTTSGHTHCTHHDVYPKGQICIGNANRRTAANQREIFRVTDSRTTILATDTSIWKTVITHVSS